MSIEILLLLPCIKFANLFLPASSASWQIQSVVMVPQDKPKDENNKHNPRGCGGEQFTLSDLLTKKPMRGNPARSLLTWWHTCFLLCTKMLDKKLWCNSVIFRVTHLD